MDRRSFLMAAAGGVVSAPAIARTVRRRLLVFGQSFAGGWYSAPVREAFLHAMPDGPRWSILVYAPGGAALLRRFTDSTGNFYLNDEARDPVGPRMDYTIGLVGTTPLDAVVWAQGQHEADLWRPGTWGMTEDQFRRRYMAGVVKVAEVIRKAANGGAWLQCPFYIQTIGWRRAADGTVYDTDGARIIRQAQMELVAYHGPRWNLHLGAVQPHDLPLADGLHPTSAGYMELARLTAAALS